MLPGSQSSKLKDATLKISGDPRFRLHTTLARGGVALLAVILAAVAVSAAVILLSNVALEEQERVQLAASCALKAEVSIDALTERIDPSRGQDALDCFGEVQPIADQPDQLFNKVHVALKAAMKAHADTNEQAEDVAITDLRASVDDAKLWIEQNRSRYKL